MVKINNIKYGLFFTICYVCAVFANAQTAPGGVTTNLELWVKANVGGVAWTDQSTNAVSVTATGSPTLNPSSLNFNDAISFNGSSDFYNTNLNIDAVNSPDLSVIAVYMPNIDDSRSVWGEDNGGFDRFIIDFNNTVCDLSLIHI